MRKFILIPLLATVLLACVALGMGTRTQERPFAALSPEERKWLDENRDNIILTYDPSFPPLEFQDKNGNYAGIAADIVAKVEKLLGVTFKKRPNPDWNALMSSLESGETHLNGGIVRTPEREQFAFFTGPYITLPLVIITTTRGFTGTVTWADLDGQRVGVVSGYASERFVRERGLNRFEVVPLKSVQEGLRDLSFGVVDAFVDNLATSTYYIEKDALANLRVAGTTDFTFPMSIGVSRKHPLLYSALQRALSEISSEEIEASRKHWISLSGEGMLSPETLRLLKLSGSFVGLLLIGLAGISFLLKRRLNEKVSILREAQQELRESEEKFRAIFNNAPLGIFRSSFGGGVLEANPALARMHGFGSVQEFIHGVRDLGQVVYQRPEDRQGLLDALLKSPSGTRQEVEFRRRDGSTFLAIINAALHMDEYGSPSFIDGTIEDITERKRLELRLAEQLTFQQALLDTIPYAVFYKGPDTRFIGFNKAYENVFGVRREDLIGKRVLDLEYLSTEDRLAYQAEDEAVIASVGMVKKEMPIPFADGALHQTIYSVTGFRLTDGTPGGLIGIIVDITDLKLAEAALRQSEEKFSRIFEMAPEWISFVRLRDSVFIDVNAAFESITGYTRQEAIGRTPPALGIWDDPAMRQEFLRRLQTEGLVKDFDFILRRKDGGLRHIRTSAQIADISGESSIVGVFHDITERKQAEELLLQKTALLEAQTNASIDGIIVISDRLERILINQRFIHLFNVPPHILDTSDDSKLFNYVLSLTADPVGFLAKVEHLYSQPHITSRDEVEFKNGMVLDRYSAPVLSADGKLYGRIWTFRDITERKQAEADLRQSEERYRSVIQNMQDVFFRTDAQARLIMISPSGLKLFGFDSADEVLGQPTGAFYMDPAARQTLLAKLQAEGVVYDHEILLKRKDGSPIQVAATVSFYRDEAGGILGTEGIFRDITERKQAEADLRQSEEKFSRIFEMAPECITLVRLKDSVIIDANAAFETITGHSKQDVIGRPVQELGVWNDPASPREFMQRLKAEGHVQDFEFLLKRKDGEVRRVVSSAQLVPIAGEEGYVSVTHDITDERRMQELLIQSEKMMSVGGLAAGIAHEINNPLGIVHQAVQNLILRTSPDQKKNLETAASLGLSMDLLQQYLKARKLDVFLEDIQTAAMRASGIIRNMLNFSRRSESKRQTCDLHSIIEQSVFLASSDYDLKKSYDFKRIEIGLDLDENLPPCNCTETEIEQVLLNLLRNSAQAMSMANPPTPNPRIDIRLRAGESSVRMEVADNGPGMNDDVQRKALAPFFTTKPPGVGTGLGLSVSYFIITKGHGGRMWLDSAPGKGTTFFIELPAVAKESTHA